MDAEEALVVGAPRLEVRIGRDTGSILSVKDRETSREWLAPGGGTRLYQIELLRPGQDPLTLDLSAATAVKAKRTAEGAQIVVESHGDIALGVRVEFIGGPGWDSLLCRLSLRNRTGYPIHAVRFPVLALPVRLGEAPGDDRVLLPLCDGLEIHHPEANLRGTRAGQYPGEASMQFLAFYDEESGLYLAALDAEGHRKQIGARRAGETVEPELTHFPVTQEWSEWTLPYPVLLDAFQGNWQKAATLYRSWAEQQPWCRTPLRKRKEIPDWLFNPALYYAVSLRGDLPEGGKGERVALVANQVAEYQQEFGAPVVAMLMEWEQHGPWIAPEYFPPVGGAAGFQDLIRALKKGGNRSLLFLSGLKWTLRKSHAGLDYEDEADFRQQAEKWAIVGLDGQPQRFGKVDGDTGEYAQICPATPLARTLLSNAIEQCQKMGLDAVQIDQIVGGGMPPCYSQAHGHPPGGGNWSARAVYTLFERLRKEARSRNKEFVLLMEEPGEYFIPVVDGYHARDYAEGRWPRSGSGVRGVPLFTYVYHDYCFGYGGDSAPLSPSPSRFSAYQHALNLIHGKMPAGAVWGRWQPPAGIHTSQRSVLRESLALLASPAGEFLLKGKRLPDLPMRLPKLSLSLVPAGAKAPEERDYPRVLSASYELPGGRLGHLLIAMGDERERLDIPIKASGLPGQRLRLNLYQLENGKVTLQSETVMTPCVYPVNLSPFSPVFLESIPAGWEIPW